MRRKSVSSILSKAHMKLSTPNEEATLVVIDVKSYEERENTLALLKILALGRRELEQGKFRDAEDVFADLDNADFQ